jgi:hypothetical protein
MSNPANYDEHNNIFKKQLIAPIPTNMSDTSQPQQHILNHLSVDEINQQFENINYDNQQDERNPVLNQYLNQIDISENQYIPTSNDSMCVTLKKQRIQSNTTPTSLNMNQIDPQISSIQNNELVSIDNQQQDQSLNETQIPPNDLQIEPHAAPQSTIHDNSNTNPALISTPKQLLLLTHQHQVSPLPTSNVPSQQPTPHQPIPIPYQSTSNLTPNLPNVQTHPNTQPQQLSLQSTIYSSVCTDPTHGSSQHAGDICHTNSSTPTPPSHQQFRQKQSSPANW